jgi:antitoxin PrlF
MDAALFQAHPELREGTYEAAYVGAGTILVRPRGPARQDAASDVDPVVAAYLAWTERAMIAQPELLRPMTAAEFQTAERLVAGVEVDVEHDRLPDDFDLP